MLKEKRKCVNKVKQNIELLSLDWDSDYFGVKSAKVNLYKEISKQDQKKIIKNSTKFEFITISNLNNNNINNAWIGEDTDAFLTDMNVQLSKKVKKKTRIFKQNYYNK